MNNSKVFWGVTVAVLLLCVLLFLAGVPVTAENQLMEIAQVVVLILAFLIMAQSHVMAFGKSPRTSSENADLSFALFLSVIPFAGAGRELNFGRMLGAGPDVVGVVELVMGAIVLILIGFSLFLLVARVKNRLSEAKRIFTGPICRAMYLATAAFIVADVFEKQKTGTAGMVFMEEVMEVFAFFMILRAAINVRRRVLEWG